MDASPTNVPVTALAESSSGVPPNAGFSQVNAGARYLIRGDATVGVSTDVYI